MAPVGGNFTDIEKNAFLRIYYCYGRRCICFLDDSGYFRFRCQFVWPSPYDELRPETEDLDSIINTSEIPLPQNQSGQDSNNELLEYITMKILLPIVLVLIAICFVLGVILIVKSYMMAPLKQNLATAIRRRRRVGHAPDNNYVPPAEMRASQHRPSSSSDRKSLPPPEVLIAARERASQLYSTS